MNPPSDGAAITTLSTRKIYRNRWAPSGSPTASCAKSNMCFWPPASRSVPIAECERMILDGTIRDSCAVSAWGLYLIWKVRQET
jgi:hypothetical protein